MKTWDDRLYEDAARYVELRAVVAQLYYAAHWRSDRLTGTEEDALWKQVRDKAYLPVGKSPKDANETR